MSVVFDRPIEAPTGQDQVVRRIYMLDKKIGSGPVGITDHSGPDLFHSVDVAMDET